MTHKTKSFTLIELLIVIAIIAVLAATIIAATGSARKQARDARRTQDLDALKQALELYYDDYKVYPHGDIGSSSVGGFCVEYAADHNKPFKTALVDNYLSQIPRDPRYEEAKCGDGTGFGSADCYCYVYRTDEEGQKFKIFAKAEQGEDFKAANDDGGTEPTMVEVYSINPGSSELTYYGGGWYEGGTSTWPYRDVYYIDNTGQAEKTNYQVEITVDTSSLVSAGKLLKNGNDMRFADKDGATPIDYWIKSASTSPAWYSLFKYRTPITVTNSGTTDLTDYQVSFTLNTNLLIGNNKMQSDCGDLRVTDSDGLTELPYWIETGTCNTNNTRVWVKLDIAAGQTKDIYAYYGTAGGSGVASASNAEAVFKSSSALFFDDFEDYTTADPTEKGNWVKTRDETGTELRIETVDGKKTLYIEENSNDNDGVIINTANSFTTNSTIVYKFMHVGGDGDLDYYVKIGEPTVNIGSYSCSHETLHRLDPGRIVGNKYLVHNDWRIHIFRPVSGNLLSAYDGETLTSSSTHSTTSTSLEYVIGNAGNPKIAIDWVSICPYSAAVTVAAPGTEEGIAEQSPNTTIVVKIPTLTANTNYPVYMYYGSGDDTNGEATLGTADNPGLSCKTISHHGNSTGDGTYTIDPNGKEIADKFDVYCDMTTDGGGWTLLSLEFSYTSWNLWTTYGDIYANGANTSNLKVVGDGSNYFYAVPFQNSPLTGFTELWAGKLNTANINDKNTTTQVIVQIPGGQSFPPNARKNATNVYENSWCASWWWGDGSDRFEIWVGEAKDCGDWGQNHTGSTPRRIYVDGSQLPWNGDPDTGTETNNNFGYLFGR